MVLFGFYYITFYAFLLQTIVQKCMYSAVQKWTEHISVSCIHGGNVIILLTADNSFLFFKAKEVEL